MSGVSSISSSLLTNLLNSQQSNPVQATSSQAQDAASADGPFFRSLGGLSKGEE